MLSLRMTLLSFSPIELLRGDSMIPPKKSTSICTEVPILMIRYLGQYLHVCGDGAFLSIGDFNRYALIFEPLRAKVGCQLWQAVKNHQTRTSVVANNLKLRVP
jgi:hypothetical protein